MNHSEGFVESSVDFVVSSEDFVASSEDFVESLVDFVVSSEDFVASSEDFVASLVEGVEEASGVVVSDGVIEASGVVASDGVIEASVGVSAFGLQAPKVVSKPSSSRTITFDFTVKTLTIFQVSGFSPILIGSLNLLPPSKKGLLAHFLTDVAIPVFELPYVVGE
jgi:hypothetical protein